jgi:hypothetical protein
MRMSEVARGAELLEVIGFVKSSAPASIPVTFDSTSSRAVTRMTGMPAVS